VGALGLIEEMFEPGSAIATAYGTDEDGYGS
jgi:hypothetical protein